MFKFSSGYRNEYFQFYGWNPTYQLIGLIKNKMMQVNMIWRYGFSEIGRFKNGF